MPHEFFDDQETQEKFNDLTDQRLIDILQDGGVIESQETRVYSRDEMLEIARGAYIQGYFDRRSYIEAEKSGIE